MRKGTRPVAESVQEYARGIAGGLLFSLPLLYTMEMWWTGFSASPRQMLLLVVATYLLLLGYNRYAGMHPEASWRSVFIDSVEEMGIGLVLSFGVLLMLNRIQLSGMALDELMGKVVLEAMAVSIGVSVGTAQLGAGNADGEQEGNNLADKAGWLGLAVIALCGSMVVGGNVAPTEEVVVLAVEAGPGHVLVMVLASLAMSGIVLYFSNFRGTSREPPRELLYYLLFDTCLTYLVALGASAFVLWFFGRFGGMAFELCFAQCVVLGVPASLGGSAGRLLIK